MSGLRRFFVSKVENEMEISGEEYTHAVNTLRLKVGDNIILCDNSGYDSICEIYDIKKKSFCARLLEKKKNDREPSCFIILICGYLKGDKTEYVVQKAVELGVSKIVVFASKYSSAYMNDNKLLRLNKVSVEAAKQCGRSVAPCVSYVPDFLSAVQSGESCKNRLFFYENKTEYATHKYFGCNDSAIIIGSEGGFSESEAELAVKHGYTVRSLGKRILRADTAAVCALSITMYEAGELN